MIPKIIHYVWLGEKKPQRSIQHCINSWGEKMPDYELRCWGNNSFDFDSVTFVKGAIAAKKYAFAADYLRLYALYTEGGIYLDSDVIVKKSFDPLLNNSFFCGTEAFLIENNVHHRMEAAIMGSEKGHPFLKKCLEFYNKIEFSLDRTGKDIVIQARISEIAVSLGYKYENVKQQLPGLTIYPTSFFTNTLYMDNSNSEEIYAIHQNAGSWIDYSDRGWLYRFCRKHNALYIYHCIERIRKYFSKKSPSMASKVPIS